MPKPHQANMLKPNIKPTAPSPAAASAESKTTITETAPNPASTPRSNPASTHDLTAILQYLTANPAWANQWQNQSLPAMFDAVQIWNKRFRNAEAARKPWQELWQECYFYALPQHDVFLNDAAPNRPELFDATAVLAAETLAANLMAELLPIGRNWFSAKCNTTTALTPARSKVNDLAADFLTTTKQDILTEVIANLQQKLHQGQFQLEIHQAMLDLVVVGTGVIMVTADASPSGFAIRSVPLTSMVLETETNGGAIFKISYLTADEILQQYSQEYTQTPNHNGKTNPANPKTNPAAAPPATQPFSNAQSGDKKPAEEKPHQTAQNPMPIVTPDTTTNTMPNTTTSGAIWHRRELASLLKKKFPNEWANNEKIPLVEIFMPTANTNRPNGMPTGMDYALFIPEPNEQLAQNQSQAILLTLGYFQTSPLVIFRMLKAAGEVYGRSPVMRALSDIKTANKAVELILKQASLAVAGIWLVDDDGVLNPNNITLQPGALIQKAVGSQGLTPLRTANLDLSQLVLQELRQQIKQALLADQLLWANNITRTATEIIELSQSQTRLLSASFGRLESELLLPLLQRLLTIMMERGEIPYWLLDEKQITWQVESPIARRQKMQEAQKLLKLFKMAAEVGVKLELGLDPSVLSQWLLNNFEFNLPKTLKS